MECPECGRDAKTIESRNHSSYVYRRQRCKCGKRFTTREMMWSEGNQTAKELEYLFRAILMMVRKGGSVGRLAGKAGVEGADLPQGRTTLEVGGHTT